MKIFRIIVLSAGLYSLAGCSTLGITTASALAAVSALQAGAVKACSFLPDVDSALKLLGSVGQSVDAGITTLCSYVAPPAPTQGLVAAPSRAGQPGQVIVNGTVIKGTYTR